MKLFKTVTAGVLALVLILTVAAPVYAVTHTVAKGENLSAISKKYGVSVAEIKAENNLTKDTIYPGQRLEINATVYTVQKGDTLTKIAQKYGTTVQRLKQDNRLSSNTIRIGQKLVISKAQTPSRSGNSSYSQEDLYWLARAVYGEARGESYTGQVAVAAVILNRVKHKDFPNTVKGVIFEPKAFTCVADGQINLEPNNTAIQAARAALAGQDPSGGALYYWNPAKATSKWVWSRPIIKKIGNHVFAK